MAAPRHIYAVRHADRIDDVDGKKKCWYLNSHFAKDNPPLSSRGVAQAEELREEFRNIPIDYCFISPYERCVQTAVKILDGRGVSEIIYIEPGLLESLQLIYERSNVKCLDYENSKELFQRYGNIINTKYNPVYLAPPETESKTGVHGCMTRVDKTFQMIVDKCQGDILIVSHQGPLAAIQQRLTGSKEFAGIATVSKYVEVPGRKGSFNAEYLHDSSHLSDPTKLFGKECNRKTSKSQRKKSA